MKKSAALPFPVDVATFERLQAAGRVAAVRLEGVAKVVDGGVRFELPAEGQLRVELVGLDLHFDRMLRWAHGGPIGEVSGTGCLTNAVEFSLTFLPREVSESSWAVGELYRLGLVKTCSIAINPAAWFAHEEGGLTIQRAQLLDVSAVPALDAAGVEEAQRRGIPLGWLKEWVEKTLDEATTSEEARLRLVVNPDQLAELHRALAGPSAQVPEGDDVLVERVEGLTAAIDRLTAAVQAQTTLMQQAASGVRLTFTADDLTKTRPPATGAASES